jgi:nucleotide-binding universal stress UspA family protein
VPPRSVVCGVDHSAGARAAARVAGELAERLALDLVLAYVVAPPIPQRELGMAARTTDAAVLEELRTHGIRLLQEVTEEVGRGREVVADIRFGEASVALAAVAEAERAELLVVGSHGHGRIGRLVLGSVSLRLAVEGPCPTVIVPEAAAAIGDAPILCAVDDSAASAAAVATAAALAGRLGAHLLLAHAAPGDGHTDDGQELLDRLAAEHGLGTSAERIVVGGDAATAIVEAATARRAGMLVVGSRGRGALASAALGSVSSAVAPRAPCPVAIVRADQPTVDDAS